MTIYVSSLLDLIRKRGEDYAKECLSFFKCEKNSEIEKFLTHNAIEFCKRKLSITYLLYGKTNDDHNYLLGYFSLAYKIIQIPRTAIPSTSQERKIRPFAEYDDVTDTYTLPAPLIAQFGKNSGVSKDILKEISGKQMMDIALDQIQHIQDLVGGKIAYLDCEENSFLLEFYKSQGFTEFNIRTPKDTSEVEYYHQLLKVL